jgi:hypothetical protein
MYTQYNNNIIKKKKVMGENLVTKNIFPGKAVLQK